MLSHHVNVGFSYLKLDIIQDFIVMQEPNATLVLIDSKVTFASKSKHGSHGLKDDDSCCECFVITDDDDDDACPVVLSRHSFLGMMIHRMAGVVFQCCHNAKSCMHHKKTATKSRRREETP